MPEDPLNILVVDDDEGMRFLTVEWLRNNGHSVMSAVDGDDCIAKLNRNIDIIFLDIMMPGPTPKVLIDNIVKKSPKALVVYMTAVNLDRVSNEQRRRGWVPVLQHPVWGYLEKPVEAYTVLSKVKEMMKVRKELIKNPPKK